MAEIPSRPHFYGTHDAVFEVTLHEPDGLTRSVPEALVQDIWRTRRFDPAALATVTGDPLDVLHPGVLNTDSGPDFSDARVRIGGDVRTGAVEIHTTSGGWFDHRHHLDPAYDAVVLHITLHADVWTGALTRTDGSLLPEVVLYPHLQASLRTLLYDYYTRPAENILCSARWAGTPSELRTTWIDQLAEERLHSRTTRLADAVREGASLDSLLHERLFAGLGYAKNTDAMAALARRLPLAFVRRLEDPFDLEALHLGIAGLLPTPGDLLRSDRATADYVMALRDRFDRLRHRFDFPAMDGAAWRFFRLRPANFPPIRVAQAAALLAPGALLRRDPIGRLADAARDIAPIAVMRKLLRSTPGAFWATHVRLVTNTRRRDPSIGLPRINALITNAVAPVLACHAARLGDPALHTAVLGILRALPVAPDEVTRRFRALGTRPRSAWEAQGIHQLYRTRCRPAHCLTCAVGQWMLGE